ncbi:hypothetical protein BCR33DRAFT_721376, partial [Rhizoclosmatium globosum]
MGRKKIKIQKITDERNRQVHPSLPTSTSLHHWRCNQGVTPSVSYCLHPKEQPSIPSISHLFPPLILTNPPKMTI